MTDGKGSENPQEGFKLLELLKLETVEENFFRGQSRCSGAPQIFGGQVLGQALQAACATVSGLDPHSMHCYFLRGGDMNIPVLYEVERSRDGRSFATRRVVAIQHGRPIFNMTVSFQVREDGFEHQDDMPQVPEPDTLEDYMDVRTRLSESIGIEYSPAIDPSWPFEVRLVDGYQGFGAGISPPRQRRWLRLKESFPDDPVLHKSALAYFSDLALIGTAMMPHPIDFTSPLRLASLDHAIWYHRDFRLDDWVLYSMDSPSASGARGYTRGQIFDRKGRLIASCCQEGLIRSLKE